MAACNVFAGRHKLEMNMSVLTTNPGPVSGTLPAQPPRMTWAKMLGWGLFLLFLAWAWKGAEMNPVLLWTDGGNMATFAADFFPPDFSEWRMYLREMLITIQIAVWGTVLAVIFGIPLGILSSSNLVPWWICQPVRRLMDALRSINEMVFAMLFVVAVGLGPFAGTLALFLGTTGVLAKLFAEAVEAIDPGPVERGARHRRECAAGSDFRGDSSGHAAVGILCAVSLRVQCPVGDGGRHGRRRRGGCAIVGSDPGLRFRTDGSHFAYYHRLRERD